MDATLKDITAVLAYIEESGRKLAKTKLYADVKKGLLRKQSDGTFRPRDVDRYAASLPTLGTPDKVVKDVSERRKRKEEADIRRVESAAAKEEFQLAVMQKRYISRDQVLLELAGRAIVLATGLKTAFEASALELIHVVEGNPQKLVNLMQMIESTLDAAMNDYAKMDDFEVMFEISATGTEDAEEAAPLTGEAE